MNDFYLNVTKLKSLLYFYVKESNSKLYRMKIIDNEISCLDSIISMLNNKDYGELYEVIFPLELLLQTVYDDTESSIIYKKIYGIIYNLKQYKKQNYTEQIAKYQVKLQNEINKIEEKKLSLQYEKEGLNNSIDLAKRDKYSLIIKKIKQKIYLFPEDISLIEDFITKCNISYKEQIRLLDQIEFNNYMVSKNITKHDNKSFNYDKKLVPDMLDFGFEQIEIPILDNLSSENKVNTICNSFINILETEELDISEAINYLPNLDNGEYSYEEFSCIMTRMLLYFQDVLYEDVTTINNKDFYKDKEIRLDLERNFINNLRIYTLLRNYNNKIIDNYNEQFKEEKKEQEVNHIYYIGTDNESFIEKDLSRIPKEHLYKIRLLINKFKQGKLSRNEIKSLSSNQKLKKQYELKDDQIRIVFYKISDNNYVIVGCDNKKSDNKINMYAQMAKRPRIIDLSTEENKRKNEEYSRNVEQRLEDYLKENARKGTR